MRHESAPEDLVLHGPRVLGFATASHIADRFGLARGTVAELLLDYEALGWVRHTSFAGSSGWSLTEAGRAEDERRLAAELGRTGARHTVAAAHQSFLPLNKRFAAACTDWQIKPASGKPMAFNDHADWRWDERVLHTLASVESSFGQLCARLSECLARFDTYADAYSSALRRVTAGLDSWLDAPDRDSCHVVWIQFHEDLLATLGLPRGSDN